MEEPRGTRRASGETEGRKPLHAVPILVDAYGLTHIGRARRKNEDAFLVADLSGRSPVRHTSLSRRACPRVAIQRQAWLFAVADGLGGMAAGERASRTALKTAVQYLFESAGERPNGGTPKEIRAALRAALEAAENAVLQEASRSSRWQGMATTLTLAYVTWPSVHLVHVGDSRAYRLRGSTIRQLTVDHTVAQKLVDEGLLPASGVEHSRWRNVMWNAIGGEGGGIVPLLRTGDLEPGDALLLCTDGLTRHLSSREIQRVLEYSGNALQACRALVQAALDRGGKDNVTVIVARFRPPEG